MKTNPKYIDLRGNPVWEHEQIEIGCLVEWDRDCDIFPWLINCGIRFSVLKHGTSFISIAPGDHTELIQQGFNDSIVDSIRKFDIGACYGYGQTYERLDDCVVILLNGLPEIVFRCLVKQVSTDSQDSQVHFW